MRIGILLTGHVHEALVGDYGDYAAMFQRLLDGHGFSFRTWKVVDMEFPKDVHDADGWLVTGSKHGAYEDLPFIRPLEDFIRKAFAERVPLVGICFGHQIIAQALGGKVEKFGGGWAAGAKDYDFGGTTLRLNAWHRDQVTEVPEGAQVVASNDFCRNAALIYGDRAFTVQAHPEIRDDYLGGLLDVRAPGVVPQPEIDAARAAIGSGTDDAIIAAQIAAFFKQPRGEQDDE